MLLEIHLGAFFLHLQYTAGSYSRGPSRYAIGDQEVPRSALPPRPPQALDRVELLPLLVLAILCFLEVSLLWGRRRRKDLGTGEQTPAQVEGSRER